MKRIIIISTICCLASTLFSQIPSPLGPVSCAPGTDIRGEISISFLTGMLRSKLEAETAAINWKIDSAAVHTDLKAKISYQITSVFPAILPTYYPDRPNSNYIRLLYNIDYTISGIRWKGIPYFDRKLSQTVTFSFYCNQWYTGTDGKSAFYTSGDKPVLNPASAAEQAVNAILGGWLLDLVNRRISQALSSNSPSGQNGGFSNYKCSCLRLQPGTAPLRDDGIIGFGFLAYATSANPSGVRVQIKSVKRLPGLQQEQLPEWESLQIEFFANYNQKLITTERMRVGDILRLEHPALDATNPGRIGLLSVIINASALQENKGSYTHAMEFSKQADFGKGSYTITLMRKKQLPASRPGTAPPMPLLIPAYEIRFEILGRDGQESIPTSF